MVLVASYNSISLRFVHFSAYCMSIEVIMDYVDRLWEASTHFYCELRVTIACP